MNFYELVFILRPDISSNEVDKEVEKLSAIITSGGGEVLKNEYWGLRDLEYSIHKNQKGHYVLLGIKADRQTTLKMEKSMNLGDSIMRHVLQKVDKIEESPSAILRDNAEQDSEKVVDVTTPAQE